MSSSRKRLVLEETTNTHTVESDNIDSIHNGEGAKAFRVGDKSEYTHGEHGTLKLRSGAGYLNVPQQEKNPVTKKMERAND